MQFDIGYANSLVFTSFDLVLPQLIILLSSLVSFSQPLYTFSKKKNHYINRITVILIVKSNKFEYKNAHYQELFSFSYVPKFYGLNLIYIKLVDKNSFLYKILYIFWLKVLVQIQNKLGLCFRKGNQKCRKNS